MEDIRTYIEPGSEEESESSAAGLGKLILLAVMIAVAAFIVWLLFLGGTSDITIRVPYYESIPQAETVANLENKFATFRGTGFGGAGAGGLGAPSVFVSSPSQFMEIAGGSRVYKTFHSTSAYTCGFKYWVLIDGGVVEYNELYNINDVNGGTKCMSYQGGHFIFKAHDVFWFHVDNVVRRAQEKGWEVEVE